MESRSFKSRFICGMVSGVMALTGAVSILPVLTSEQNAIVASAIGGGSGGGNGGKGGIPGSLSSGEFANVSGTPLGVRIYLAPRKLLYGDTYKVQGRVFYTGNLTAGAIKANLHSQVRNAYYAVSKTSYNNTVSALWSVRGKLNRDNNNKYYQGAGVNYQLKDYYAINKDMYKVTNKDTFDFSAVLPSNVAKTCPRWGTHGSLGSNFEAKCEKVADWANNVFRNDANVDYFLQKYTELLGEDAEGLPKNVDEFTRDFKWVIVVEPVYCMTMGGTYLAISNQDLINANKTHIYWSSSLAAPGYIGNTGATAAALSRNFYSKYKNQLGKEFSASGKDDLAGFGVYWGRTAFPLTMSSDAKAATHITYYSTDGTPTYDEVHNSTGWSGDLKVRRSSVVADNASVKPAVSTTKKDSLNIAITNKGASKDDTYKVLKTGYDEKNAVQNVKFISFGDTLRTGLAKSGKARKASELDNNITSTYSHEEVSYRLLTGHAPLGTVSEAYINASSDGTLSFGKSDTSGYANLVGDIWSSTKDSNYYLRKANAAEVALPAWKGTKNLNALKSFTNVSSVSSSNYPNFTMKITKTGLSGGSASNIVLGNKYNYVLNNSNLSADKTGTNSSGLMNANADKISREVTGSKKSATVSYLLKEKNSSGKLASKEYDVKGIMSSSDANNIIANTTMLALENSEIKRASNQSLDLSTKGTQKIGLSVAVLARKHPVSSTVKGVVIDENGTSHNMTVNNDKSGKASVKYDMTATGSFNVSGSKAWANGDNGVTYMFALPKSYTSKSYKGLDDLAEKVSKIANDNNGTLNTVNAYNQLHKLFMNVSGASNGYQTGSSNGAVFDMLDSSKDKFSFTVGSIGGSNSGEGKIEGYDILIYRDERVGKPQHFDVELPEYYLNYNYPTLFGTQNGVVAKISSALGNGSATISYTDNKSYSGDLISKNKSQNYLLFNPMKTSGGSYVAGALFDLEQTNPKQFAKAKNVGATHSMNLTREFFGETKTISKLSMRNKGLLGGYADNSISNAYVKNVLKSGTGVKPTASTQGTSGKSIYLSKTGNDSFFWAAKTSITTGDNAFLSPWTTGERANKAGYTVTEKAKSYTPNDRGISENDKKGTTSVSKGDKTYGISTIKGFDTATKFYPEVTMVAHVPMTGSVSDVSNGKQKAMYVLPLYVMGDKVRQVKTSAMYTMTLVNGDNENNYKGTFAGTFATGSIENGLDKIKVDGSYLPVTYSGTEVNVATNFDKTGLVFNGFVLDLMDKDIDKEMWSGSKKTSAADVLGDVDLKTEWGNTSATVTKGFDDFVSNITDSLYAGIYLKTSDTKTGKRVNGTYCFGKQKKSIVKKNSGSTKIVSYNIKVKDGDIVKDTTYTELIKAIATAYGVGTEDAERLFNNSGMVQSLVKAVETRYNKDNGSAVMDADVRATTSIKYNIYKKGTKWYDEEVNYFVIRQYTTDTYELNDISVGSKLAYDASPSGKDSGIIDAGYRGDWYYMLGIESDKVDGLDSVSFDGKDVKTLERAADKANTPIILDGVRLKGASFILGDETTNSMKN